MGVGTRPINRDMAIGARVTDSFRQVTNLIVHRSRMRHTSMAKKQAPTLSSEQISEVRPVAPSELPGTKRPHSAPLAMSADRPDLADFAGLEAQLVAEFSPPLRPEEVQRCLIGCVTHYQSATVSNYLAVLVEREARDRLHALARERTP